MRSPHSNKIFPVDDRFVYKVGAVVVKKMEGRWFFGYFRSITRPQRGFQIVRGGVDPGEDIDTALRREIAEEYGRKVRILGKLLVHHHYVSGTFVDIQFFYLAEDIEEATPDLVWRIEDGDADAQLLEWKFAPIDQDLSFLSRGQAPVVELARKRLMS